MKKILVATDLSANSKAGLRFAIQLATQNNYKLTFFHVYRILRPTRWSDAVFTSFENTEHEKIKRSLSKFVSALYSSIDALEHAFDCVIQKGISPDKSIRQYAEENNYDYICIGRHGEGRTARMFGSTISALIKKSNVPVIAVPDNYKRTPVKSITYASDLSNLENELKRVNDFAVPLHARVEMLHFRVPVDYLMQPEQYTNLTKKLKEYHVTAHFDVLNYEETLISNMNKVLKQSKPSLMVMFSKQKRSLFERLFLSSISAEYAHISKIPLLVFKKD